MCLMGTFLASEICAYRARDVPDGPGDNVPMKKDGASPPHFLRAWREHMGMTQDQLAERAGIGRPAISKIEAGERPLMQNRMDSFAKALGISVQDLFRVPEGAPVKVDQAPPVESPNAARAARAAIEDEAKVSPGKEYMPVWGSAAGSPMGGEVVALNTGDPQLWVPTPGILHGVNGAFGVYILGDSMTPALKPGWVAWVHPHTPPQPDDDVVIEMRDHQAFVKTLVQRTPKLIRCKQYNPPGPVDYPAANVRKLYLIVGSTRIRG